MIKNFFKTSSIYFGATIAEKVIALIFFSYLAHILSIEDMGKYSIYLIFYTILSFLLSLEIKSGFGRFYFEHKDDNRKNFELTILNSSILINILMIIPVYISYNLFNNFIPIDKDIFNILLILTIFDSLIYLFLFKARYDKKDLHYVILTLLKPILLVSSFFILNIYIENEIFLIFLSMLISSSILVVLFFVVNYIKVYKFYINFHMLKQSLTFSIWLVPSSIGSYFSNFTDKVMIEKMINTSSVGIYSVFQKISTLVVTAIEPLYNVIMPKVMENYKNDNFKQEYYLYINIILFVLLIINLFIAIFAKDIVVLLGGDKYIEYYKFIYLFLVLNIFIFIPKFLALNIHLSKQSKYVTAVEVISGILNILVNIVFITHFGLIGAIYATLITYFIRLVMYDYFAKKLFDKFHIKYSYYLSYISFSIFLFYCTYLIQENIDLLYKVPIYIILILFVIIYFYYSSSYDTRCKILNKIRGIYNAR
jgi:O-antigen/teichoic acid export membrane protein